MTDLGIYTSAQALIYLNIAAYAYCGQKSYSSMDWGTGVVKDFVPTKVIYKSGYFSDTEGFVGYLPSDKSIFLAFRGTESNANWFTNLDARKMNWKSHPECSGC